MTDYSNKLTNLRALAILIVVLGHSIIMFDPGWSLFQPTTQAYHPFVVLKKIINLIQMPLFFSISGYLYFWTVNRRSFKKILKTKTFRILIPFVMVLLLYSNPIKHCLGIQGYESYRYLLHQNIFLQHLGHLWFLPVLFTLFVLSYVPLRWKSPQLSIIFIPILIILAYGSRFLPSYFVINSTAYYWVYFYVGGIMNKYKVLEKYNTGGGYFKITLSILLIILIIIGSLLPYGYTIPISLIIIPISYFIIPNTTTASIEFIASLSFGIYLFHSPLIYIAYIHFPKCDPWVILIINLILFGIIAALITLAIKKSKFKFIIGE